MEDYKMVSRAPRMVEVIGPTAAGKTSVCQALVSQSEYVRLKSIADLQGMNVPPFHVRHDRRTIPDALHLSGHSNRQPSARDLLAWPDILSAWASPLEAKRESNHYVILLDQGPVYLLTEYCELGHAHLRRRFAARAWQALEARWATILEAIVWLDAPNAILGQRIHDRGQGDIGVTGSDAVAPYPFDLFRAAYARTLSLLAAHNANFRLLLFDTSQQTCDQIAAELLAALGLRRGCPMSSRVSKTAGERA